MSRDFSKIERSYSFGGKVIDVRGPQACGKTTWILAEIKKLTSEGKNGVRLLAVEVTGIRKTKEFLKLVDDPSIERIYIDHDGYAHAEEGAS